MLPVMPGSYDAIVSGYTSKFTVDNLNYIATFDKGVRGFGIVDTIELYSNSEITSKVLGSGLVSLHILL